MTAIATVSGRVLNFMEPTIESIGLEDLAAGLAAMPRYAGQTIARYSVAQHSLLVARLVEPRFRLHALLHDAAEAYMGDVPSPLKDAMRQVQAVQGRGSISPYDVIEEWVLGAIFARYGIAGDIPDEVREADALALAIEAPMLQPRGWRLPLWDNVRRSHGIAGAQSEAVGHFLDVSRTEHGGGLEWFVEVSGLVKRRP